MPFSSVKVTAPFTVEAKLYVKADEKCALDGEMRQRYFDDDAEVLVLIDKEGAA
jgi:hypothetical protein